MGAKLCCTDKVHQPQPTQKNLLANQHRRELRADFPAKNISIADNNSVPDKLEAHNGHDIPNELDTKATNNGEENGHDIPNELDTKATNNGEEKHNTKVVDNGDNIPEDLNTKVPDKCDDIPADLKPKAADNGEDILEDMDTNASDRGNNIRDHLRPKSLNLPNAKIPETSIIATGENKPSELEANIYMNETGDVFTSAAPLLGVSRVGTLGINSAVGLANSN